MRNFNFEGLEERAAANIEKKDKERVAAIRAIGEKEARRQEAIAKTWGEAYDKLKEKEKAEAKEEAAAEAERIAKQERDKARKARFIPTEEEEERREMLREMLRGTNLQPAEREKPEEKKELTWFEEMYRDIDKLRAEGKKIAESLKPEEEKEKEKLEQEPPEEDEERAGLREMLRSMGTRERKENNE